MNENSYEIEVPQLKDVSFADSLFQDIILRMFFDTHKDMNITLSNHHLLIPSNSYNNPNIIYLELSHFIDLSVLEIGDKSFSYVQSVNLDNMNKLKNITIGKEVWNRYMDDFVLESIPSLETIIIGQSSLMFTHSISILNNPMLQSIYFYDYSFHNTYSLTLLSSEVYFSIQSRSSWFIYFITR